MSEEKTCKQCGQVFKDGDAEEQYCGPCEQNALKDPQPKPKQAGEWRVFIFGDRVFVGTDENNFLVCVSTKSRALSRPSSPEEYKKDEATAKRIVEDHTLCQPIREKGFKTFEQMQADQIHDLSAVNSKLRAKLQEAERVIAELKESNASRRDHS